MKRNINKYISFVTWKALSCSSFIWFLEFLSSSSALQVVASEYNCYCQYKYLLTSPGWAGSGNSRWRTSDWTRTRPGSHFRGLPGTGGDKSLCYCCPLCPHLEYLHVSPQLRYQDDQRQLLDAEVPDCGGGNAPEVSWHHVQKPARINCITSITYSIVCWKSRIHLCLFEEYVRSQPQIVKFSISRDSTASMHNTWWYARVMDGLKATND